MAGYLAQSLNFQVMVIKAFTALAISAWFVGMCSKRPARAPWNKGLKEVLLTFLKLIIIFGFNG
jgi:hypothetical protein